MKETGIGWIWKNEKIRKYFPLFVIALPIAVFFVNLFVYAVNIPYNDDYETILGFLNQYLSTGDWNAHFNSIIGFWNDHRQPFNKAVTLIVYFIFHQVDLRLIILIGNLGLLVMLAAVYRSFKISADKLLYFIPVAFLLFQPAYSENSLFAMASLTNFYVMSFGFLSISFLAVREKIRPGGFAWALVLAVAAYYTQGNGVLFLLIGLIVCVYRKDFPKVGIWTVVSAAAICFYQFYGINRAGNSSYFQMDPARLLNSAVYFFTFVGNNFGLSSTSGYFASMNPLIRLAVSGLPAAAGFAITVYFVFITFKKYYKTNPAVYALFLFLFFTAFGASMARGVYGLDQALSSRYKVVGIFFIILTYISLLEIAGEKRKKTVFTVFLGFSILFSAAMFVLKQKPMLEHKTNLITSMTNWEKTGTGINPLGHPNAYANNILNDSVKARIFLPPQLIKKTGK